MSSFTVNKAAGSALMTGVLLWFTVSVLSPGAISDELVEQGDFFRQQLLPWVENSGLTHVMTMLTMLSAALQAFGFYYLLRLPRQPGVADFALRFGVLATISGWVVLIIAMGIRHMIVHVLTHGIEPAMPEAARLDVGLTLYAAHVGVIFGFFALGAIGSFIVGLALAARFRGLLHIRVAGYGIVATGIGQVINLVFIEHLHDVDFGVLATASTVLLGLGGLWLFIVGYGIFRGHGEFTRIPDPDSGPARVS
ncbi:MAG: hypothetical protein OXE50_12020 [Chloroflexi bacterium]|nr:hypothetical protein [Chloroflexota bacterium]